MGNCVYTMQKPIAIPTQTLENSRRIQAASYLTWSSILVAWWSGLWTSCVLAIMVFLSSQLYWRHPVIGWRRTLDMVCVNTSVVYQVGYLALWLPLVSRLLYYASVAVVLACYLRARHYGRVVGDLNRAAWWHVGVHIVGNMGNVYLYSVSAPLVP